VLHNNKQGLGNVGFLLASHYSWESWHLWILHVALFHANSAFSCFLPKYVDMMIMWLSQYLTDMWKGALASKMVSAEGHRFLLLPSQPCCSAVGLNRSWRPRRQQCMYR